MENLIFSLNATIPIFLMMLLGMLFRKLGWMDEVFAAKMNKFVFLVPLPVLLFEQLATVDFSEVWDIKFILFLFCGDGDQYYDINFDFTAVERSEH